LTHKLETQLEAHNWIFTIRHTHINTYTQLDIKNYKHKFRHTQLHTHIQTNKLDTLLHTHN